MESIGITSNIKKYYKGYIDFIDHYWIKVFQKKNLNYILIPNNKILSDKCLNKIGILILSGGNDIQINKKESKIRNKIEFNLIKKSLKKKIPILGICRGAQLLNIYFKGRIRKAKGHMRNRHNIFLKKNKIFKKKLLNVNSFHNYVISTKDISSKLEVIAIDKNKNIEMYISPENQIIATMWHPEREKNLKNLYKIINFLKK